jgi:hypothetical protein
MNRISISDDPRYSTSNSASFKVDWRPLPGLSLSGSYQISTYESADAVRRLQFRIQRPQTWNADVHHLLPLCPAGPIGQRCAVQSEQHLGHEHRLPRQGGHDPHRLAPGDLQEGTVGHLRSGQRLHVTRLLQGHRERPLLDGRRQLQRRPHRTGKHRRRHSTKRLGSHDRFGAQFNYSDLSKWNTPTIQARSGKAESLDDVFNYKFDLRRELDFLPWDAVRLAFKTGFLREETLKKKWGLGTNYRQTYVGPALTSADYLDTTYQGFDPGFGFAPQQWISTYRLYDIYAANPQYFNANSDSDQIQ